jgi:hypothetical protein
MSNQLEMFRPGVTRDDVAELSRWLHRKGWQTRAEIAVNLLWSERKIRDVAESMGASVVRGQNGFKLTADLDRSELGALTQAADAALSQGKRMIRYGLALRRKGHEVLG